MSDPVYLVSRCSSVEEFVAAFRRYADRLGVFVPSAAPVTVGRKARFAITLKDGGIVIEGDAEVIMSSTRASGLHGRPGMTLRFAKVDDDSRAVLDHLEKVRFGAKVTVASSHLKVRPGPAQADPGPPSPAKPGTDPAQLLAECVVVGDTAPAAQAGGSGPTRRAPGSVPPPVGASASGKFAIPAIMPRTGVTAPTAAVEPAAPPPVPVPPPTRPTPPPIPAMAPPGQVPGASTGPRLTATGQRPTMMGAAVADPRLPGPVTAPIAAPIVTPGSGPNDGVPARATGLSGAVTVAGGAATVQMMSPMSSPPAPPEAVPVETPWLRHTTRGVAPPGINEIEMGPPIPVGRGSPPPGDKMVIDTPLPPGREGRPPPQANVLPTAAPMPVPAPPVLPEAAPRRPQPPKTRTMMGLQAILRDPAIPSSPGIALPGIHDTDQMDALPAPEPARPPVSDAFAHAPTDLAEGAISRTNTIEIDPSLLEPTDAQVVIDPHAADDVAVVAQGWPPPDRARSSPPGYPPHHGHGGADGRAVTDAGSGFFDEGAAQDASHEAAHQGRGVGYVTDSNTGFFTETGAQPVIGYSTDDATALVQASPRQKRMLVIVLSCLGVFVIGFIAILVIGGKSKRSSNLPAVVAKGSGSAGSAMAAPPPATGSGSAGSSAAITPDLGSGSGSAATPAVGSGSAATPAVGSGSGSSATPAVGAGSGSSATPEVGAGSGSAAPIKAAGAGPCKVKVTSSPSGSDVMVAGKNRGKTPLELALSCASTQISVRRSHYNTWTKTVRPKAKATLKVNARLDRPMFTVKVSSVPSGATVSVGSRKAGKTPTAVKVPGYDATTITLTKDGYANASERVTAKQNGTAIKMTLRKK